MKRAGFRMIELIFVIVILGILAAVAIPKLAATRTDAEISKMATNAATFVSDYGAAWTARGDLVTGTTWSSVTNTQTETEAGTPSDAGTALGTAVLLTDGTNTCVTFTASADSNTSTEFSILTVTTGSTGTICAAVQKMVLGLTKAHNFGGTSVTY